MVDLHICVAGNTRVISQNALQTFQDEMAKVKKDPYKVVMRQTKLPISLLNETAKVSHCYTPRAYSYAEGYIGFAFLLICSFICMYV